MRSLNRVQRVIIPQLRAELPDDVTVVSWVADTDYRVFPIVQVRRLGGLAKDRRRIDRAVIELTAYTQVDLPTTEDLLLDAMTVLYDMVDSQVSNPYGSICSYRETMGPTQFDSPFEDSWRVQALIQLGVRPPRVGGL